MPLALFWRRQGEEGSSETPGPTDGTGETTTSPDVEPTTPPPGTTTTTATATTTTTSSSTSTRTTTTSTSTTTSTTTPPPSPSPSPSSSVTTTTTESVSESLSTTLSDSSSSQPSAPAGPAFPSGNTKTIDPTNNFVDPTGITNDFDSNIAPLPTQSTGSLPAEQESSSSSKALPIVLPCLLIPIALAAILVMIIRRRRQQHSQMLDEFTHRSTFYGGAAPGGGDGHSGKEIMMTGSSSNLARSPSLASSRYHDTYGPTSPNGGGSHMDYTMPPMMHNQTYLSAGNTGFATAAAPVRAHQHTRSGSDDLDIKCAGRIESSASFGALYDQYGSNGVPGQTQAADGGASGMLAYDRSSVAAPMPDHPYASAQAQTYPATYQQGYQQQVQPQQYDAYSQQYAQYASYPQQQQAQYAGYPQQQYASYPQQQQAQYQAYSQHQYPAQQYQQQHAPSTSIDASAQDSGFSQRSQLNNFNSASPISPLSPPGPTAPLIASTHSRTVTNSPPQLNLPAFSFDFNNVSNTASPISAMFQNDDPFADPGSEGAAAAAAKVPTANDFPSPPKRVSMERRAARTKSIEQRLMMALDDTQRASTLD